MARFLIVLAFLGEASVCHSEIDTVYRPWAIALAECVLRDL